MPEKLTPKEQLPDHEIIELKLRFTSDPVLVEKVAAFYATRTFESMVADNPDIQFQPSLIAAVAGNAAESTRIIGGAVQLPDSQWPDNILSTVDLLMLTDDYCGSQRASGSADG